MYDPRTQINSAVKGRQRLIDAINEINDIPEFSQYTERLCQLVNEMGVEIITVAKHEGIPVSIN